MEYHLKKNLLIGWMNSDCIATERSCYNIIFIIRIEFITEVSL